jgi:hypothetical protein
LANHSRGDSYGFYPEVRLLNWWPTKKPLLPPGDFLHIILLVGNVCKASSEGNFFAGVRHEIAARPRENFYRISDDKRTSQISASAESLLRRWEFVGIGFFIFFLTFPQITNFVFLTPITMKTGIKNLKNSILLKSFLLRFAIFAAGWLVLVGGQQLSDFGS